MKYKNVIIIGVAKCGTSSLFQYLKQHPNITPSYTKEINYFVNDGNLSKGFKPTLESYYTKMKIRPTNNQITLDASPLYFHTEGVMDSVGIIDNPYIILMLRDPIERLYSNHQMVSKMYKDNPRFEDSWRDNLTNPTCQYVEFGLKWLERYPNLKIIKLEDMERQPDVVVKTILEDLGVSTEVNINYDPVIPYGSGKPKSHYPKLDENLRNKIYNEWKWYYNLIEEKLNVKWERLL